MIGSSHKARTPAVETTATSINLPAFAAPEMDVPQKRGGGRGITIARPADGMQRRASALMAPGAQLDACTGVDTRLLYTVTTPASSCSGIWTPSLCLLRHKTHAVAIDQVAHKAESGGTQGRIRSRESFKVRSSRFIRACKVMV